MRAAAAGGANGGRRLIALLLFVASLLAGAAWARLLPGRIGWPERAAGAAVISVFAGMWASWLAVLVCGFAAGVAVATLALAGATFAGWWLARRRGAPPTAPLPRRLRWWWLGTTAPLSALLVYLDSTHFLPLLDGGWGSAGSTWGDLALHASLTARFSQEPRFEWDFPLLHGAPLTYPFLNDFWSGVLHRGGMSMRWALLLPTLLLGLALVQLLFFAGWRAARSRLAAVFACLLVLFDGSAAGLPVFWLELRGEGLPFVEYLRHVRHDFAHVPAINVRFSNIICDALLPQRGMLAGLCAFLLAVLLLRSAWERTRGARDGDDECDARGSLAGAALVLGGLPFVHVHTFLVLAGVMAWLAAARFVQRRPRAWHWAAALFGGIVLAAPQLGWQLGHSFGESFSHWQLGWMTAPGESPIAFWARNLGVLLPFLATAPWWLRRWPARGFWLHLMAPCLALFAIANVYLFQPHAYDNLKLLFYAYLALALGTAWLLAGWWRRRGWVGKVVAVAVVLLATTSGALSVLREATLHWPLLDADEVAIGFELRRLTPPDARFLVADQHDHPVPIIAGRRIVLGYRGWLWTYGLHVAPVLADVRSIYAGEDAAPLLLRKYGVDYVFIGPGERRAFAVNDAWFAGRYPLLFERGPYFVYEVGYGTGADGTAAGGVSGTKLRVPEGSRPANVSASK
ncbi:MAG TPA: hypothetical protein VGS57_19060 [Thermoanaerobaculia bacterium]|nr:hypothetical protein [Thermoanaerobaculia bacterium]